MLAGNEWMHLTPAKRLIISEDVLVLSFRGLPSLYRFLFTFFQEEMNAEPCSSLFRPHQTLGFVFM